MQPKPNSSKLVAAFLLLSAALSIALLAVRNFYDDEIFSYFLVIAKARTILNVSAEGDVHPPGMYLLAHLAYCMLPSFRWMNLFPGFVLYAGLAVFLFQVTPLFRRTRAQLCLLLLATLHPQLLMWSMTFRWYSWWTGLALIVLTIALQPRLEKPVLSTARALMLGLLLACLFYLNYITLLFAVALTAAIWMRYGSQPRATLLRRSFVSLLLFFLLIAPQLRTMIVVHLPDGRAQRYGIATSSLRLLQSIATSEAFLPWHPLALVAAGVFLVLTTAGCAVLLRSTRSVGAQSRRLPQPALAALTLFGLSLFLLVALSGLGGKPRNGLLLIPVLAVVAAWIFESLRPRAQTVILLCLAVWSADGAAHLLGRYGLTKATMNDRPEQVIALIRPASARIQACTVVLTYDGALAFDLAEADLANVFVISPYRGMPAPEHNARAEACGTTRLYVVHSYLGGSASRAQAFNHELAAAEQLFQAPAQVDRLDRDPDASIKRRLARIPSFGGDLDAVARLPDFRYVVTSGPIDPTQLAALRLRMPHFVSEAPSIPGQAPADLTR